MNLSAQNFSAQTSFNHLDASLKPSSASQENKLIKIRRDLSRSEPKGASDKLNNHRDATSKSEDTNLQHLAIATDISQLADCEFTSDKQFSSNKEENAQPKTVTFEARRIRIESPQSGLFVTESSDNLRQSDKSLSINDAGFKSAMPIYHDRQLNMTPSIDSPCFLPTHNKLPETVTLLGNLEDTNQSPLILQGFRTENQLGELNEPDSGQINTRGMLSQMVDSPLRHQETSSCDSPTYFLNAEENKENYRGCLTPNKIEGSDRPIVRRNIIGNSRIRSTIVEDQDLESNGEANIRRDQLQMTQEQDSPEINNARPLADSEVIFIRGPTSSNEATIQVPQNPTRRQQTQRSPANQQRLHQNMLETLEAKLTLKRAIINMIILFILSCIIVASPFKTLYRRAFIALYICFLWLLIENYVRATNYTREAWRRKEDIFNGLDAICGIVFISFVDIKWSVGSPVTVVACLPFLMTAVIYARTSQAPKTVTMTNLLQRCHYLFQVFFITMNLDAVLDWDWLIISILSFPYFGILAILMAFNIIGFFIIFTFSISHCQICNRESNIFLFGNLWFLLHFSVKIIAFVAVLGLTRISSRSSKGYTILNTCATIVSYESGILLVLSVFVYNYVVDFIKVYNSAQNQVEVHNLEEKKSPRFDLKVEKKESYFVMLSNTYFKPMDNKFFEKSKESLQAIQKRILSLSFKRGLTSKKNQTRKVKEAISLNVLKRYKDVLDKTFAKIMRTTSGAALKMKREKAKVKSGSLSKMPDENSEQCKTDQNSRASNNAIGKKHLSAEDLDRIKNLTENADQPTDRDDKLCYLCYTNPANAILLDCKHGGICYSCAVALIKKKNECMQCRTEIKAIYKISTNTNPFDIVKGVELTKITMIDG